MVVPTAISLKVLILYQRWFEIVTCGVRNHIRSCDDERLHWLEKDFVQYFVKWRVSLRNTKKLVWKNIFAKKTQVTSPAGLSFRKIIKGYSVIVLHPTYKI